MKTKNLALSAVLLGLGTIMHFITPPLLFGIKPDFLLVTAFIAIYIAADLKSTLIISLAAGVIAAITTGFPMGQIPNIIDKLVSGFFVFFIYKSMKFDLSQFKMAFVAFFGTLVSGLVFLAAALSLIDKLDMFVESLPIVLITMPINALIATLIFKALHLTIKRKNY